MKTREDNDTKGTVLARHLIQSFLPGEVNPIKAHEIGMELCKKILKGDYEFVLATHLVLEELKTKSSKNLFRILNEHYKNLQAKQEEIMKKHNSLSVEYDELEHLKNNMNDYLGRERIANKKSKESIVKQINDIRKIENHSYRRKNKNRNIER